MDNYVNAGRWFSILYRRSQQFIVEACQRMGLTFSEFTLLVRIHDTPGVKQDDLAKVLFLDKAVVTRTINALEQKGFIVRSQDKLDKRVKHVYLSVEAESYYPFLHNVLKRWMDYLCEGMKKKDVEKMETLFQHLTGRACEAILPDLAKDISEEFSKEDWQHELEKKEQYSFWGSAGCPFCTHHPGGLRSGGGSCPEGSPGEDPAGGQGQPQRGKLLRHREGAL